MTASPNPIRAFAVLERKTLIKLKNGRHRAATTVEARALADVEQLQKTVRLAALGMWRRQDRIWKRCKLEAVERAAGI